MRFKKFVAYGRDKADKSVLKMVATAEVFDYRAEEDEAVAEVLSFSWAYQVETLMSKRKAMRYER